MVAVALPAIGRNLHVGIQGLQWTVTNYTLPLAAVTKKVAVRAEAVSNTVSRRVTPEEDLPATASDPATVRSIFAGDPYPVMTDAKPGTVESAWENPFAAGRHSIRNVTYFDPPGAS